MPSDAEALIAYGAGWFSLLYVTVLTGGCGGWCSIPSQSLDPMGLFTDSGKSKFKGPGAGSMGRIILLSFAPGSQSLLLTVSQALHQNCSHTSLCLGPPPLLPCQVLGKPHSEVLFYFVLFSNTEGNTSQVPGIQLVLSRQQPPS